jgi:hypothetical protein
LGSSSWLNTLFNNDRLTLKPTTESDTSGIGFNDQSRSSGVERYTTDYFCGSQVAIFLGDIWLNEISMIQYQMVQNKRPFYGYKSQKYDLVARGTQLVNGAFSMNYTHTNFLNMVVSKWLDKDHSVSRAGADGTVDEASVQQFLLDVRNKKVSLSDLDYVNILDKETAGKTAQLEFEDKVSILESYFWGLDSKTQPEKMAVLPPDNLPGFDIMITFGNYPGDRRVQDEYLSSHTVKIINDVHITGHSIQVAMTGEPIQEVFTFLAKGVDTPLTRIPKRLVTQMGE